jgi:hypothetical protein
MARKVAIGVNWQGSLDYKALLERIQIADAVGVHSAWVAEAWGRDAFTILTMIPLLKLKGEIDAIRKMRRVGWVMTHPTCDVTMTQKRTNSTCLLT